MASKQQEFVASPEAKDVESPSRTSSPNPPPEPRSRTRIVLLMSSLSLVVFLAALDQSIIATALPVIAEDLEASSTTYAWVASSYFVGVASSMPIWGRVSDIFGRKGSILMANGIFMVGSLVCALAPSLAVLIAGRAIQGIGGGGLLVLTNVCISDLFSLRERGFYLSIVGGTWTIAASIGPLLGGVFSEYATWRWCFWINVPIDALSLVGLFFFLDIHNPRTPFLQGIAAIDWLGALFSAGGTIMLLLGIEFGGTAYPWRSATVISLIVFGILTWGVFVLIQWKVARFPLIPLRIFKTRSTVAIMLLCFFHAISFISEAFYLPLYFQVVLGATPFQSGVWNLASCIPLSFVTVVIGVVIQRTGNYLVLIIGGMVLLTLGLGLYTDYRTYQSWPRVIIYQIIASIGMGPGFQAPIVALQSNLRPKDVAAGTAAFQSLRQLSSAIGVVLGQVILTAQVRQRTHVLSAANLAGHAVEQLRSGSLVTAIRVLPQLETDVEVQAVKTVDNDSLRVMWIFFTCASACGLLASLFIGQRLLTSSHTEFKTGLQSQKDESDEKRQVETT